MELLITGGSPGGGGGWMQEEKQTPSDEMVAGLVFFEPSNELRLMDVSEWAAMEKQYETTHSSQWWVPLHEVACLGCGETFCYLHAQWRWGPRTCAAKKESCCLMKDHTSHLDLQTAWVP